MSKEHVGNVYKIEITNLKDNSKNNQKKAEVEVEIYN